jgi:hypothetical protein
MSWLYKNKKIEESFVEEQISNGKIGFVYLITDNTNGMKYVGKKLVVTKKKLPPLKGMKRKRTKIVQTDWMKYYGSSEEVKQKIVEVGEENFTREILFWCKSKGELSYVELHYQVQLGVLFKPDEFYNAFVGVKIHRNHVKDVDVASLPKIN